ncbi:DUF5799 family protein [Natronomonas marina]|jgi:hypothetical protein|uniref:DUF5799 family protein n=1 Tax=Natronomonas marina TaxID=2961939 RepID=UPI0020C9FCCA|nr:DUF5799 family protein [Natronomonas marina]
MSDWQDMIVGDRMTVDDEFSTQVDNSPFSRQEWGLIMTATSFEIENPDDGEAAELVADTSDLPSVLPELEKVANMGPMGQPQESDAGGGGGIVDSLLDALGIGDGGSDDGVEEEKLEAAESMVAAYADELQAHLESDGRWEEVRAAAAEADRE